MKSNRFLVVSAMVLSTLISVNTAFASIPECQTDPEIVGKLSYSSTDRLMSCDSVVARNIKSLQNSTPKSGATESKFVNYSTRTYTVSTTTLKKFAVSICTKDEKNYVFTKVAHETIEQTKVQTDLGNGEFRVSNGNTRNEFNYVVSLLSECSL